MGPVAERLGRALQKLPLQFESGRDLHPTKKPASKGLVFVLPNPSKAPQDFCKEEVKQNKTAQQEWFLS